MYELKPYFYSHELEQAVYFSRDGRANKYSEFASLGLYSR